ncbi:MAG: 4Fe-4S dicluster domain-containing protein [Ammonifex sp.]|nr:MAG: 4Fe-4S dicluster domain-containing protein [Ammonifex sp.]
MQEFTVTLNGREVAAEPGMTILELARREGVHIPTICHEPHLAPAGGCPSISSCRVCIVEEERSGNLITSCGAFVTPGMVINTASQRVLERRRTIVELMLASHPDSCMVCLKGNRCQLRQVAADMGIGLVRFQRIPLMSTITDANPFIKRNLSKCILCAKCIRACQELVIEGAVDYYRRGFVARPATAGDTPLEESECTFCGTCVAMCPTGALMEAEPLYRGTAGTSVPTTCPFCGCGCTVRLKVKEGRVVRVIPNNDDPVTRGTLCVKGSYGFDFIQSRDRLTTPLIKVDDHFEAASWEEAFNVITAEFKRIKSRYGSNSLAVFGSSKCTNEENYLLQRFARCVLGTNNIDNGSRLYGTPGLTSCDPASGFFGATNSLTAMEKADVILVVGADPTVSAPLVGYTIKRAVRCMDAKLVLIDPRETRLSMFAETWLRPKVGTDLILLNGMAKAIIDEGLHDAEISEETIDFKAFAKSLSAYTAAFVEKATGVPYTEIVKAAREYATSGKAAIVYGHGITQHVNGTDAIKALTNLALLTGSRSKGTCIYPLQKENNAQGACDMGALPDFLPGYQQVSDLKSRRTFEDYWGIIPAAAGLTAFEMIKGAKAGTIKGMYIVGENPAASFPNSKFVSEALSSLNFLVVQDLFMTRTAKLSNVVLPAASFAEKEGTFTSFDGRVNWLTKAVQPPGQSIPDWDIVIKLAARMGHAMFYSSPREVREEIGKLVPLYKGIGYGSPEEPLDQVRAKGGFRSPLVYRKRPDRIPSFYLVHMTATPDRTNGEYPFLLLTGSNLYHFAGGTRTSRAPRLRKYSLDAFVDIGEADAEKLEVSEGDRLRIASSTSEIVATARISDTLPERVVFMPFALACNPVSQLLDIILDLERKTPIVKCVSVKIERIGSHGQAGSKQSN